jgi:competence ComEA-like helix-hairpin-helix protein
MAAVALASHREPSSNEAPRHAPEPARAERSVALAQRDQFKTKRSGRAGESPTARALRMGEPLALNRATEADLVLLPGIGPALAQRIVASRMEAGPFPDVDALDRVRGIGPRTLERLRPLLSVGIPEDADPEPGRDAEEVHGADVPDR